MKNLLTNLPTYQLTNLPFSLVLSIFFLISCNKEYEESSVEFDSIYQESVEFDIENGNLIMSNSNIVKELYNDIKNDNEKEISFIKDYYEMGFQPLNLLDIANDKDIERYLLRKATYKKDTLKENVINNDSFASLLSENGEIQVGDSLYKYTKDGLYITHIDDRHLLNNNVKMANKSLSNLDEDRVELYVPNTAEIQDFNIVPIDDCEAGREDQLYNNGDEFYGCSGTSGGGNSSGSGNNNRNTPNTAHYNECVNSKAGWIDNIFGKSYVCEYYFDDQHKLRTIFESADFYFFQDVYAQAKFKEKSWAGWWFSDRSADEVYLLNKKVILNTKTKKRGFDLSFGWEEAVDVFNEIHSFFLSKPESTLAYISNEYDFNSKTTITHVASPQNLLAHASNTLNLVVPPTTQSKPLLDIDFDLKNFFGKKIDKAITINIMSLKYDLSNTEIIKLAYEALSGKNIDLNKGQTGAIVFVYTDTKTKEAKPVAYSLFGEKVSVKKLAVAARSYDVPQNFIIDDFSILFKSKYSNSTGKTKNTIGYKFKFRIDVVNSANIELESGAYYKGKWGGSKFKVEY